MKLFVAILLIISPFTDLDKIARVNKAKKEAKEAFLSNDYQLAHDKYKFLIDSLGVKEEEVLLDFSHSLYQLNDTTNAENNYQELSESANKKISSIAEQQLGQIMFDKKQYEPALEHQKNALRKDPTNKDARYNYELLKKVIQKQEEEKQDQQDQDQENKDKQDQDKENKDQEKKDEENKDQEQKDKEKKDQEEQEKENKDEQEKQDQEQKDQEKKDGEKDEDQEKKEEQKDKEEKEGEKSEEKEKEQPKPTPSDKLKEMNISEEKAKMILEAMKNNEIQYIQQNRRKATKKKDNDKPDW